jgi:hypothetical protein
VKAAGFLAPAALLAAASTVAAQEATVSARPLERALVPLFGGDTDIGLGAGLIGSLARPHPGPDSFRWKLEGAAFASAKIDEGPRAWMPFADVFLQASRTGLLGGRLRLELRPSYTRESNLRYYGLGNASRAPPDDVPARDFYTRVHPTVRGRARLRLGGPVHLLVGSSYIYNRLEINPQSRLAADLAQPAAAGDLLHLTARHGVHLVEGAVVVDTRDDQVSPSRGQHHEIGARVSPWQRPGLPYRFAGASANLRVFLPLWPDRLVLAARLVGDILVGDVPLYELARFEETSALGGAKFVRGIPTNRYYGKRKAMGNLELRSRLARFGAGGSRYAVGVTAFLDGGRVWADTRPAPELDGATAGLKYGVGGGLRVQKGETFVLRADLAWSPDARPIGAYLLAGQLF